MPWPPPELSKSILPNMGLWSAWYAGDPELLSAVYGGRTGNDPTQTGFFASDHGGFKATMGRALQRWFWGEPTRGPDRRLKLHVPIAADLCQASADLIFAEQVNFDVDGKDTATQDRLELYGEDGLHATLSEAAEVGAALGGVFLRVAWDENLMDHSFLTTVDADQAWPEYSYGQLVAVTFWQVVARDEKKVWRHLERHELDSQGVGIILHGLYEGEEDRLGHPVPLTDSTATAALAVLVDENASISTQSPGLAVEYVPNQRPQRRWRTDPLGRNLGRSDLDGVEPLMDSLDETYSSWMRDVRLGRARLMVAKTLLEDNGPGNGASFSADREVYSSLNVLGKGDLPLSQQIEQVQFTIRYEEHRSTAQQLVEDILRTAGYSAQTFGEGDTGNIRTATEVEQRERRSLLTRDRKIRLWKPRTARIVEKLLAVDQAVFGAKVTPQRPDVNFADGVQETPLALAQTVQALYTAESASTEVRVRIVHPDWDDDAVTAEVALIMQEQAAKVPAMMDPAGGSFDAGTDPNAVDDARMNDGNPAGA
jgi:A118 family predicted phage portal protein